MLFKLAGIMINVLTVDRAGELVHPTQPASGLATPSALLTIKVPNVDAAIQELTERGVVFLQQSIDHSWGRHTAVFRAPSGHTWELATTYPLSSRQLHTAAPQPSST